MRARECEEVGEARAELLALVQVRQRRVKRPLRDAAEMRPRRDHAAEMRRAMMESKETEAREIEAAKRDVEVVKREAATTVSHEEAARIAIPTDYTVGRGWLGRGRLGSLRLGRLDELRAVRSTLAATRRGCTGSVRLRHDSQ